MTRTSVRLLVCLSLICCVLPMMAQQSVGAAKLPRQQRTATGGQDNHLFFRDRL